MKNPSRFRAVRAVLLEIWDPIGIGEVNAAQDEYDAYVPGILRLLEKGASRDDLASYLSDIATTQMGLIEDEARNRAAAERLLQLRL